MKSVISSIRNHFVADSLKHQRRVLNGSHVAGLSAVVA